jgi:hypothetical protein
MNSDRDSQIESLTDETCWAVLGTGQIGRLAVTALDGADIFPVDYKVGNGLVYFRSAPGQKLIDLTANPVVAFEADGILDRFRWSVVVRGTAQRMSSDADIETSAVQHLKSHSPTAKWKYVRITPSSITGRRFRAR